MTATEPPGTGSVVVDERSGRVGVVVAALGPHVQLRPLGGGREWDALPHLVREATARERLHAAVAVANAWSRTVPREPGWPGWPG
ncbi:hypothetical protein ACH4RA_23815 [Streptomyces smyrnaeus]|uniref:hypothetical protein n=1 Tax=Streptomyces TaxID=1883 RepID=UPI000C177A43|nr:hypothetical protein [Streptomyces sp. RK75]MBQ0866559.1 hypothetical protein [Streptomyces sp. RK75]MBQ1157793.1 hypothetical protein [Streptomyces sp. A73]